MVENENAAAMISGQNRDIPLMVHGRRNARTTQNAYIPIKLAFEWGVALVASILILPLLALLAILVKVTSHGPVIYKQSRLGYKGRVFNIYKFRTMVKNAESVTGPVWAAKQDSRVTPLGRILRQSHLDELPQLWNILKLDMSLVGPRPERPEIAGRITRQVPDFPRRLDVRPGVTGLAQVMLPADDPGDVNFDGVRKKLDFDLLYAKNLHLMVDLRIYISTACKMAAGLLEFVRHWLTKPYGNVLENNRVATNEPIPYERAV
jgi:lipopolysaccharide/colanic/teichoic acid biosynthesis glycosyltransferase